MANFYINSVAGSNTAPYDTWAKGATKITTAFSAMSSGDRAFVAHDHAETTAAAITLTPPHTAANYCQIWCVNRAGTVPPVSADKRTTATITVTGSNRITINGGGYYYGITFTGCSGSASSSTAAVIIDVTGSSAATAYFEACLFVDGSTDGFSNYVSMASANFGNIVFDNTSIKALAGSGNRGVFTVPSFYWKNTAAPVVGSVFPADLVLTNQNGAILDGLDLTATGFSGKAAIFFNQTGSDSIIRNCKLHASLNAWSNTPLNGRFAGYLVNSDSAATNYRNEKKAYTGSQVPETTIVRTGGATDGTTPIATKIVTTANVSRVFPYESLPLTAWNDTTAANVTVTVYGIWGGGAVPNNDDIWIEVSYLGASTSPIATFNIANRVADFLTTGTGQASDTSTWGGSTTKFKMAVTLSSPQPGLKGPISVIVKAAATSGTFYIDPKVVLS